MNNKKHILLGVLALILVFGSSVPGRAAEVDKNDQKAVQQTEAAPIEIEADQVYFSETSGDMFARGNVKITQSQDMIVADYAKGNTKQAMIWVEGSATLFQPAMEFTGKGITYNYGNKTGLLEQGSGIVTEYKGGSPGSGKQVKQYISGQNMQIAPGYIVAQSGTFTTCSLPRPDYHISAEKIELWPEDKLIAREVKFWLGDKQLFTLKSYQKSLKPGDVSGSAFPRIGYNSDDGVYIKQHLEFPLRRRLSVYTDLDYYTKADFKPSIGLKWSQPGYTARLMAGNFSDSDNRWIKKEPELRVDFDSKRIGASPVSYKVSAAYGKWSDDEKSSWHQDYTIYFLHDPIPLDQRKSLNLYLGTGWEHIRESYQNNTQNIFKYDATLDKTWSPRLSTWVGYHKTQEDQAVFRYDKSDLARELAAGFTYKLDKVNSITFKQSYDLDNNRVYDRDYTWTRDLHCWQMDITYREKREQWRFHVSALNF